MSARRKPTRRDLLIVVGRLENIIGAIGAAFNDRNPNRSAQVDQLVRRGLALCHDARGHDPPLPVRPRGPWAEGEPGSDGKADAV